LADIKGIVKMTEKQMELLLAFMAKEVLTDVDPALRRAVFAPQSAQRFIL